VTYAYSILSDPSRRDDYDQIKHYHFTKEQALQTFDEFFKTYGLLPNEEEFFRTYYPNRKRTYYAVLDVPKNASDKLILESFRRKALDCHPLNFPGDKYK
jgi:curved DNA-binding protein CbpA